MASIEETLKSINLILQSSQEGSYSKYSCKTVSWDDVQRGTISGSISCWGPNITDTRLYAKDERQLFTVRGDNWNERLGRVSTKELALIASDDDGGGGGTMSIRPHTLHTILKDISKYGGYAGMDVDSILDESLDQKVSVRFQTTFLPVNEEKGKFSALEFAPEAYNYNTMTDDNPRNLILLCTTQGVAIQQDGKGAKKLFHHVKSNGQVKRYWLEAESSKQKVGAAQNESEEEKIDALRRGKATSSVIGIRAMGTRFNVLMTIQIPLEQKKTLGQPTTLFSEDTFSYGSPLSDAMPVGAMACDMSEDLSLPMKKSMFRSVGSGMLSRKKKGVSSAARVSRGSEVDTWGGLTVEEPKRHPNEHITATIVMYYTCLGGVPTEVDVKAAIDDLEKLYQSVEENGTLSEPKFDFMKSELQVKDAINIDAKLKFQPPPKPCPPESWNAFP